MSLRNGQLKVYFVKFLYCKNCFKFPIDIDGHFHIIHIKQVLPHKKSYGTRGSKLILPEYSRRAQ